MKISDEDIGLLARYIAEMRGDIIFWTDPPELTLRKVRAMARELLAARKVVEFAREGSEDDYDFFDALDDALDDYDAVLNEPPQGRE